MPDNSEEYYNLVEEIADVQIVLEQMKFFLTAGYDVNRIIDEKLDRQICRIEHESDKQKAGEKSEDN